MGHPPKVSTKDATAFVLGEFAFEEGQLLRHKPTGIIGKVKWTPLQATLPFYYIEYVDKNGDLALRQGQESDFEIMEEDSNAN